jgi:hypothetical protein
MSCSVFAEVAIVFTGAAVAVAATAAAAVSCHLPVQQ